MSENVKRELIVMDFDFEVEEVGDWAKVANLVANMQKELEAAREMSLKRWGLKAERVAKLHISTQDLGWKALDPKYLATKVRKGLSENILVATSSYFQSITSYVDKETVYAGVKKDVKNKDGEVIADIAKLHEYGSDGGKLPARPLWRPTYEEVIEWHFKENMPEKYFLKAIRSYGV